MLVRQSVHPLISSHTFFVAVAGAAGRKLLAFPLSATDVGGVDVRDIAFHIVFVTKPPSVHGQAVYCNGVVVTVVSWLVDGIGHVNSSRHFL